MQILAEDDDVTDRNARAAAAATERVCAATRRVRPVGELIRFVIGPDGAVVRPRTMCWSLPQMLVVIGLMMTPWSIFLPCGVFNSG